MNDRKRADVGDNEIAEHLVKLITLGYLRIVSLEPPRFEATEKGRRAIAEAAFSVPR